MLIAVQMCPSNIVDCSGKKYWKKLLDSVLGKTECYLNFLFLAPPIVCCNLLIMKLTYRSESSFNVHQLDEIFR